MDLTPELVVAVASLITAIAAIVGLYLTREQAKGTREGAAEQNQQLSNAVKNLAEIVVVQRKQLESLGQRLDALVSEQQRRGAIAERQVLQQQEAQNWNLLIAAGKALGWMYDRGWLD